MWLLPLFSPIARMALRTFYRLEVAGSTVPPSGPVLLVANHPNSLLDPAAVVAAAGRPVRFLAKAPLFGDPQVGWLIRGAGAIPVYRRSDDPSLMERNDETFRAAHEALRGGAAVGIFPEGISHSEPSLAPLKTGAARIALGAAGEPGSTFPIVPIGLSLRDKERFRSEALIVIGDPIPWDDLAMRGGDETDPVRELTERIDAGLQRVTLNLQRWDDAPLVEYAAEIFLAEEATAPDPATRLQALREAAEGLRKVRADGRSDWAELARHVARHARVLRTLGLRPHELNQPRPAETVPWLLRTALSFAIAAPAILVGTVVFLVPYRLTGLLAARSGQEPDIRATYKLLVGSVVYLVWTLLIAGVAAARWGATGFIYAVLALPLLGSATLALRDRRHAARDAIRRYLVRSRRADLLRTLRDEQRVLARRVAELRASLQR